MSRGHLAWEAIWTRRRRIQIVNIEVCAWDLALHLDETRARATEYCSFYHNKLQVPTLSDLSRPLSNTVRFSHHKLSLGNELTEILAEVWSDMLRCQKANAEARVNKSHLTMALERRRSTKIETTSYHAWTNQRRTRCPFKGYDNNESSKTRKDCQIKRKHRGRWPRPYSWLPSNSRRQGRHCN